jgi:hypothetical protein
MPNLITTGALLAVFGNPAAIAATRPATDPVSSAAVTTRPIEGISYERGSKRAVGYFEPRDRKCQVTLMIAEAVDPDKASPLSAARLSSPMGQGGSAVLTSEKGGSIKLTCGAGAQTVAVNAAGKKESRR